MTQDLVIRDANGPWLRMVRARRHQDVIGSQLTQWFPPDRRRSTEAMLGFLDEGDRRSFEAEVRPLLGPHVHTVVTAYAERAGDEVLISAVFADVTAIRRAEAEARVADLMRELDASQGARRADANALVDLEAVVSELTAERDAALRQCAQAGGTGSPNAADGDHAGAAAPATMAELRAELEHATAERDQALAELQARVASEVGTGANGGADAPAAASEAAVTTPPKTDSV